MRSHAWSLLGSTAYLWELGRSAPFFRAGVCGRHFPSYLCTALPVNTQTMVHRCSNPQLNKNGMQAINRWTMRQTLREIHPPHRYGCHCSKNHQLKSAQVYSTNWLNGRHVACTHSILGG